MYHVLRLFVSTRYQAKHTDSRHKYARTNTVSRRILVARGHDVLKETGKILWTLAHKDQGSTYVREKLWA